MVAIKGENIVKHIERGEMGPAPDTDLLCETYIHGTVTQNKSKATKRVTKIIFFQEFEYVTFRKLIPFGQRKITCFTWGSGVL